MKREEEILSSIKSFSETSFKREELLPELLDLQSELINLTFNGEHAENADLRLWDIKKHFSVLNERKGHIADAELRDFSERSEEVCNLISGEISGKIGENRMFRTLELAKCRPLIIKNAEFVTDEVRTEIDALAITEKAVFILEVKNTGNNIHIDDRGNYSRVKYDHENLDCNIAEKMNCREYLIQKFLKKAGIEKINVVSVLVFTNSSINIKNDYAFLDFCYLSQLAHYIDMYKGEPIYSPEEKSLIESVIRKEETDEKYTPEIDMKQFKTSFAVLMAALEEKEEEEVMERNPKEAAPLIAKKWEMPVWMKAVGIGSAVGVAAGAFFTLVTGR